MEKIKILLVEDDKVLSRLIKEYLEKRDFTVLVDNHGDKAAELVMQEHPDIVILDIMLPLRSGTEICKELRRFYYGPIMMLTALDEEVDQIVGIEIGADAYLTKPVSPRLLQTRINGLLRLIARKKPSGLVQPDGPSSEDLSVGPLRIHFASRTVYYDNTPVNMTTAQYDLLSFLAAHAGTVLSRDEIYQQLYGIEYDGINRAVDQLIVCIREKINDDSKNPYLIKSVRGKGYLLVKDR